MHLSYDFLRAEKKLLEIFEAGYYERDYRDVFGFQILVYDDDRRRAERAFLYNFFMVKTNKTHCGVDPVAVAKDIQ